MNPEIGAKTVVLVHGLCTDGSVWRKVIPLLQQQGVEVTAAQIPNNTLEDDIGTVRRTLDMQAGPVTLVGHSYGGLVISGMGKHASVRNLVYTAALAPDDDEMMSFLMTKVPAACTVAPVSDGAGWMWPTKEGMIEGLMHDAEPADQELLWATRKSFGGVLYSSTVSDPVWKTKPSYYLVSSEDRRIAPATQRFMAERMKATTAEVATSHLSPITRPDAVAELILRALAA